MAKIWTSVFAALMIGTAVMGIDFAILGHVADALAAVDAGLPR